MVIKIKCSSESDHGWHQWHHGILRGHLHTNSLTSGMNWAIGENKRLLMFTVFELGFNKSIQRANKVSVGGKLIAVTGATVGNTS